MQKCHDRHFSATTWLTKKIPDRQINDNYESLAAHNAERKLVSFCECLGGCTLRRPVFVWGTYAFYVFMQRVTGLSSQRSLMPLDPGRRLDGITWNWIVFHLLWKQPGRDTPQPSPPSHPSTSIPAVSYCSTPPPFFGAPLFPFHYEGMSHTEPLLLHVIQSFPLQCRNAGLDVSRVLNKAAACTIPAAEMQHCVVYHPNGVEQYA